MGEAGGHRAEPDQLLALGPGPGEAARALEHEVHEPFGRFGRVHGEIRKTLGGKEGLPSRSERDATTGRRAEPRVGQTPADRALVEHHPVELGVALVARERDGAPEPDPHPADVFAGFEEDLAGAHFHGLGRTREPREFGVGEPGEIGHATELVDPDRREIRRRAVGCGRGRHDSGRRTRKRVSPGCDSTLRLP